MIERDDWMTVGNLAMGKISMASVSTAFRHHGTSCIYWESYPCHILKSGSTYATHTALVISAMAVMTGQELECPVANIDAHHDLIVRVILAEQSLIPTVIPCVFEGNDIFCMIDMMIGSIRNQVECKLKKWDIVLNKWPMIHLGDFIRHNVRCSNSIC